MWWQQLEDEHEDIVISVNPDACTGTLILTAQIVYFSGYLTEPV